MRLGEKVRFLQDYSTHTGAPTGPEARAADEEDEVRDTIRDFLQYYQDDYRFDDRGTLIIGVQWLRTKDRQTIQPHLLTGAFATPQVPPSAPPAVRHDNLLPYLTLTYNVDARNLIRLIGNKSRVRFGGPLLAPSEAFIVEEPVNVLDGQVETYELDYERRFSARTFGKLFWQSSLAYRWNIQPTLDQSFDTRELIVPKVEERLVGLLVEHQITRYLSSLTRLEYVQAEDRTRIAYGPDGQLLGSDPNPSRGLQVPISPQWRGLFGFNYVDRSGTKVGLMAGVFSREFIDVESGSPFNMSEFGGSDFQRNQKRVSFRARTLFDLHIAKEPSLGIEYGLIVSNLFNTRIPDWPSYPRRGRLWFLEIARRF
jgi:outer membrane receptor protein involved in Fe transport